MEEECSYGKTVHILKESLKTIRLKDTELTNGQMVRAIQAIGKKIKCMVKAVSNGQMDASTPESLIKTNDQVKERWYGPMVESTKAGG